MKKLILLLSFCFLMNLATAQPDENTDPFGNSYIDPLSNTSGIDATTNVSSEYDWSWRTGIIMAPPPPPTPVPIDGGVGLLLIGGIGYGLRKIKRK